MHLDHNVPPHVVKARYDYGSMHTACLEETRTQLLDKIFTWALGRSSDVEASPPTVSSDGKQPNIFWLNGQAGTGKSTVAYTVAQWSHKKKALGASFFCSRSDAD